MGERGTPRSRGSAQRPATEPGDRRRRLVVAEVAEVDGVVGVVGVASVVSVASVGQGRGVGGPPDAEGWVSI